MMKKTKILLYFTIFICMAILSFAETIDSTAAGSIEIQAQSGTPKAVVAQKAFTFDEVLEGEMVTHAFLIENQGTAPLKVLDVHTSCGCTTAQRPGVIAPGAQDEIVVKGNTNGYGGRIFHKIIMVSTNDSLQPRIELQLSGPAVQFARIEPNHIVLRGRKDEALQAEATITSNPKYPFRISSTKIDNHLAENIDVHMEQRKGIYHIIISNRRSERGSYRGRIMLKTDNAARPVLSLFVQGRIME
ncbi:MAG: DUF1573 domain-containing protein [Desulfatitalea sp.]|nr:DUF1573 domain-containing protein [Desulfatitalea sp.]NNK01535.1 DUF1573 domain-containing protein [Desulfatitalea sp.]